METVQKDAEGVDEMAPLRERARGAAPPLEPGVQKDRSPERGKSRSKKRKTKKEKKEKKDKKGRQEESEKSDKRRKKGSSRCSSDHLEGVRMDGTRAKLASHKAAKALYQGTGLDPRDRVRWRDLLVAIFERGPRRARPATLAHRPRAAQWMASTSRKRPFSRLHRK